MSFDEVRLDDATLYLARELEQIKSKVYDQPLPELKGRKHIPMTEEPAGPGAETYTYRVLTAVGQAALGLGFPRVDSHIKEITQRIEPLTSSYGYTFQEVRAAMMAKRPLSVTRAMAAKRAIAEREDNLIYFGNNEAGIMGIFNNPNVPIVVLPHAINASSTPDQIIETFTQLISNSFIVGQRMPDTILMSQQAWIHVTTRRLTDVGTNLYKYMQSVFPGISFDWCVPCRTAGYGESEVLFAYRRSTEFIQLEVAHDFEQLPPDVFSTETIVNCHERFGGVSNVYPLYTAIGELPAAS